MKKKEHKNNYVAEDLQQRIDFTDWLKDNPKMRPKRKKPRYNKPKHKSKRVPQEK